MCRQSIVVVFVVMEGLWTGGVQNRLIEYNMNDDIQ